MENSNIDIAIADDHQMFIDGLKMLLTEDEGISILHTAIDGGQLLEQLKDQPVSVVLMDINMPGIGGLEATKVICKQYPATKVIALTMYNTKEFIKNLLNAGVKGYILKNADKSELLKAIRTVAGGETYYSQAITETIMRSMTKARPSAYDMPPDLSKREIDVLKLIVQEYTTQEIADKLFISHNTVESHRKNLISKLNVRNSAGLVKYAIENGLAD